MARASVVTLRTLNTVLELVVFSPNSDRTSWISFPEAHP